MKTELTLEQSARLIELGVDPSRASESAKVYESIDTDHRWESVVPIFRFTDILWLLPKEIEKDRESGSFARDILIIRWSGNFWIAGYSWRVEKIAAELIDALFELLVWVLENHPDEIKKSNED